MRKIEIEARKSDGRSHRCESCKFKFIDFRSEVCRVYSKTYIEAFIKGAKFQQNQKDKIK